MHYHELSAYTVSEGTKEDQGKSMMCALTYSVHTTKVTCQCLTEK